MTAYRENVDNLIPKSIYLRNKLVFTSFDANNDYKLIIVKPVFP